MMSHLLRRAAVMTNIQTVTEATTVTEASHGCLSDQDQDQDEGPDAKVRQAVSWQPTGSIDFK